MCWRIRPRVPESGKGDYFIVSGGKRGSAPGGCIIEARTTDTGQKHWAVPSTTNYENCHLILDPSRELLAYTDDACGHTRLHRLPEGRFICSISASTTKDPESPFCAKSLPTPRMAICCT